MAPLTDAQLTDLEVRLLLEKTCKAPEKKTSCAELTYMVAYLANKFKEQEANNDDIQSRVTELEGQSNDQSRHATEARLYKLEKNSIAQNLIVKGITLVGETETKEETRGKVNDILTAIGVSTDIVEDCFRFKRSAEASRDRPPVVLIKLKHARYKGDVYKNVNKLKDLREFKISIKDQYPPSLGPAVFEAEKKAWQLRKDSGFTLKTRINVVRGKVLIQKKGPGDQHFQYLE